MRAKEGNIIHQSRQVKMYNHLYVSQCSLPAHMNLTGQRGLLFMSISTGGSMLAIAGSL